MATSTFGYNWNNTAQWSNLNVNHTDQNTKTNSIVNSQNQSILSDNTNHNQIKNMKSTSEPRREMITRLYRTILGREPDTAGMNYYLFNTHLSEAQISKEMYESTEHAELLMKAKDVKDMIRIVDESNKKCKEMKSTIESLQVIIKNYKSLLDHKNELINQLRQTLELGNSVQDIYVNPYQNSNEQNVPKSQNHDNNSHQVVSNEGHMEHGNDGSFLLKDPFEEEYTPGKGIIDRIRNWFKFD